MFVIWKYLMFVAALLSSVQLVQALTLTKTKVLESKIPNPQDPWATWNDSLSLINAGSDTVLINKIHFVVPEGKQAHLQFGYKVAYKKEGYVSGPVLKPNQPFQFFLVSDKTIPPGARVPITGFRLESCIECPTSGSSPNSRLDTIETMVIFETNAGKDTLRVVGDIASPSSGIKPGIGKVSGVGFKHGERIPLHDGLGRQTAKSRSNLIRFNNVPHPIGVPP